MMKPHGTARPSWLEHPQHAHLRPHVERLPEPHKTLLLKMTEHPETRLKLLQDEQSRDHEERQGLEGQLTRTEADDKREEELFMMTRKRAERVVELQRALGALKRETG